MLQSIWAEWHSRFDGTIELIWIDGTIDLSWIAQSIGGIITINLSWIAQSIWRIDFEHMFHCAQKLFFLHITVGKSNVFGNFFVFDSGEIQLMAQSIGTIKMLWFQKNADIIIFPSSINVQNIKPMIQLIQLKTLFLVKHTLRKQQKFGCFFVLTRNWRKRLKEIDWQEEQWRVVEYSKQNWIAHGVAFQIKENLEYNRWSNSAFSLSKFGNRNADWRKKKWKLMKELIFQANEDSIWLRWKYMIEKEENNGRINEEEVKLMAEA